jgi:hypothetical protein
LPDETKAIWYGVWYIESMTSRIHF